MWLYDAAAATAATTTTARAVSRRTIAVAAAASLLPSCCRSLLAAAGGSSGGTVRHEAMTSRPQRADRPNRSASCAPVSGVPAADDSRHITAAACRAFPFISLVAVRDGRSPQATAPWEASPPRSRTGVLLRPA